MGWVISEGTGLVPRANFGLCSRIFLCHTFTHGKQRQRQERSKESAETQAQTGARPQAGIIHAGPAEIEPAQPLRL